MKICHSQYTHGDSFFINESTNESPKFKLKLIAIAMDHFDTDKWLATLLLSD